MKIISRIPQEKVLVSLTTNELANLLGKNSSYSLNIKDIDNIIEKEENIKISDIYMKYQLINNLQQSPEYNKARSKLKDILEALTPIEEKIKNLSEAIKTKENE